MIPRRRRGETVVELLAGTVVPVVGSVAAGVILAETTSMPRWACYLIGVPVGTLGGWLILFGVPFLVFWMADRRKKAKNR